MTLRFTDDNPVYDPNLQAVIFRGCASDGGFVICVVSDEALRDRARTRDRLTAEEMVGLYKSYRAPIQAAALRAFADGIKTPQGYVLVDTTALNGG
jgi:hypothetical protein